MNDSAPFDHHAACQHTVYRMSCEDFDGLLADCRRCCQICRTPEAATTRGKLVIDHDYRYGFMAVRGLVCDKCNSLMRRVDAGERLPTAEVYNYLHRSWFIRVIRQRRVDYLRRRS